MSSFRTSLPAADTSTTIDSHSTSGRVTGSQFRCVDDDLALGQRISGFDYHDFDFAHGFGGVRDFWSAGSCPKVPVGSNKIKSRNSNESRTPLSLGKSHYCTTILLSLSNHRAALTCPCVCALERLGIYPSVALILNRFH